MATRADLVEHGATMTMVVDEARQNLSDGWDALDVTLTALASAKTMQAIEELLAGIVSTWGDVASTLGADWYDLLREQAGAPGSFSALTFEPYNPDQVRGVVARAAQPVKFDAPDATELEKMFSRVEGSAQRLVRAAEREAIAESAVRDPVKPKIARVPMGAETCAFCLVMASRGAVYRDAMTAGTSPDLREHDKFHDWCDCETLIVYPGDELPEGYDPRELTKTYKAARRAAKSSELKPILAELRRQHGIR